jgi:hypothetical protein
MYVLPHARAPLSSGRFSCRSAGLLLSQRTLASYLKASKDGLDLSVTKLISNIFAAKSFMLIRFEINYKYYFHGITNPSHFKISVLFLHSMSQVRIKEEGCGGCVELCTKIVDLYESETQAIFVRESHS